MGRMSDDRIVIKVMVNRPAGVRSRGHPKKRSGMNRHKVYKKKKKKKKILSRFLHDQQWLPIINETSKIQCRIVISQVLDENRGLFLILS